MDANITAGFWIEGKLKMNAKSDNRKGERLQDDPYLCPGKSEALFTRTYMRGAPLLRLICIKATVKDRICQGDDVWKCAAEAYIAA